MDRADDLPDRVPARPGRSRASSVRRGAVVLLVASVVAVGAVVLSRTAPGRGSEAAWPGGCGLQGHPQWCARPSAAMTAGSLESVVRAWCPGLAHGPLRPQRVALADLGGGEALASTGGDRVRGTEHALLGRRQVFAWVTRTVGGSTDGQVEIRCPGSTHEVPGLRLTGSQYRSTVLARSHGRTRRLDFVEVARTAVLGANPRKDLSFGSVACDTSAVGLSSLRPGRPFTCRWEGYGPPGKTVLGAQFRVTSREPWFRRVRP